MPPLPEAPGEVPKKSAADRAPGRGRAGGRSQRGRRVGKKNGWLRGVCRRGGRRHATWHRPPCMPRSAPSPPLPPRASPPNTPGRVEPLGAAAALPGAAPLPGRALRPPPAFGVAKLRPAGCTGGVPTTACSPLFPTLLVRLRSTTGRACREKRGAAGRQRVPKGLALEADAACSAALLPAPTRCFAAHVPS